MKIKFFSIIAIALFVYGCASLTGMGTSGATTGGNGQEDIRSGDAQIENLISQMTIEEKVGQMTQMNLDVVGVGEIYKLEEPHRIDTAKLHNALLKWHVGSFLNCGGHAYSREQWHTLIGEIQRVATTETRLKIPIVYGIDAIHGANYVFGSTLFPQQIGQAATFNPAMSKKAGEVTAYETRAAGISWNFSPVLDVARHPAWSRFFETYGEDPLVCSRFGVATVQGYQGTATPVDSLHVAACMKHFLGYSGARTGKDRTPAYIPEISLREIYLPSFKAAIDAGAMTVMINSGEINGKPVHASKDILIGLLRNELKFKGVAVTDWEDIIKLHVNHRVAPSIKEATYMAVEAGIDMCMVPNDYDFSKYLIELVKEGRITESRLNISVRRILEMKKALGLFDHNAMPSVQAYPNFGSTASQQLAKDIAAESITLLKNENKVLPLNTSAKVLVTGPAANSLTIQNGAWTRTWQGVDPQYNDESKNTIMESMKLIGGSNVSFEEGCMLYETGNAAAAIAAAANAEYIVVCLGEKPSTEKPGDIDDLTMPKAQLDFVKAIKQTGKKVILVLVQNRPQLVNDIVNDCDAIVLAYEPGDYGADALADILYGKINPSGKLPFTYPRHNQSMIWYDHKYTETVDQNFGNNAFQPQWPFGFGLSYSEVVYESIRLDRDTLVGPNIINVSITISNRSDRAVKESVLLFLSDRYASMTPAVRKLKDFEKIEIGPNSSKNVTFSLRRADLGFIGEDMKLTIEPGDFDIFIGERKASFYYKNY